MIRAKDFERIIRGSIDTKIGTILKGEAFRKYSFAKELLKEWKLDARAKLSTHRRGDKRNKTLYPFLVTGALRKTIRYKLKAPTFNSRKNTWKFSVRNWYEEAINPKSGYDYARILNSSDARFGGYRERLTGILHERLKDIMR